MSQISPITWTADMMVMIEHLWIEGLSVNNIAKALSEATGQDVTKNMVSGRVHRMGLKRRPSPIEPKPGKPPRRNAPITLRNRPKPAATPSLPPHTGPTPRFNPYPITRDEPYPADKPIPPGHHIFADGTPCQWPQVDPAKDGLRCTEPRLDGWPYCDCHARRAYHSFGIEYKPGEIKWLSGSGGIRRTA